MSAREQEFFAAHQHYDYGEAIANVGALLWSLVRRAPKAAQTAINQQLDAPPNTYPIEGLVQNLERLVEQRHLDVHPALLGVIVQYRSVIEFMWEFFGAMRSNPRKDTFFDDALLQQLIRDAGGLPSGRLPRDAILFE